jgi:hypothetical protein
MVEKLTAYPVTGLQPVDIFVEKSIPIGKGNDPKELVIGYVESRSGDTRRKIQLFKRRTSSKYIKNWKDLNAVGLPVVPTLRICSGTTMILTDMKADGSEIYGKGLRDVLKFRKEKRERPSEEIDQIFLDITNEENIKVVRGKALEYVERANRNGIKLASDDPFELIIHPDGKWDFIMLDLFYASKVDASKDGIFTDVSECNRILYKYFFGVVENIRVLLAEEQNLRIGARVSKFFVNL